MPVSPLVIWRFSDSKAGHDNQSRGLVEALNRWRPVESITLSPQPTARMLAALLLGQAPTAWRDLPTPDVLVGAGHQTHFSLLAARRRRDGKAVVLMRPSLPLGCFDLCLIPEHDSPPTRANVLTTRGALNRIRPASDLQLDRGLFLIGGPSAHFGWDETSLYRQIAAILATTAGIRWILTTSRRTPTPFLNGLASDSNGALTVIPATETGPDWLPAQFAQAAQVWVTADSVSMVYEALTAGARVGVLELPPKQPNRIGRGLDGLAAQGWVTFFSHWRQTAPLSRPSGTFDEAERCARWIIERWFA